jgi:L-arabinokinase
MDLSATLQSCRAIHQRQAEIIECELSYIKNHDIRLIIGDTPPLCFEIAARAALPSISITNFTWDIIYRAYIEEYPGFGPLVEEMTRFYGNATLALTLPYPCDTSMFPRQQPIPWVARHSLLTRRQARMKFALPQSATIVLLSFGGLGLPHFPWTRLKQETDFLFVATGDDKQGSEDNLRLLPESQSQYEDLVRAADVIVTKPGYGIVADVLAHRLPILYTDRGNFSEYPYLVDALSACATSEFIPQEELLDGNVAPYLSRLLGKELNWPPVDLTGAQIAATKILELL